MGALILFPFIASRQLLNFLMDIKIFYEFSILNKRRFLPKVLDSSLKSPPAPL